MILATPKLINIIDMLIINNLDMLTRNGLIIIGNIIINDTIIHIISNCKYKSFIIFCLS